jgi:hypothetical protein
MELPRPLHPEPVSIFGSFFHLDAYESSHMLAMPLTLPLSALMLADPSSPRGSLSNLTAAGTLSEGFSTARYQAA